MIKLQFYCFVAALAINQANARCLVPSIGNATVYHNNVIVPSGRMIGSGSEVEVRCNLGYVPISGTVTAFCHENGRWLFIEPPRRFPHCQQENFDECGKGAPVKEGSGEHAVRGEFPWMARLEIMHLRSISRRICGATLISASWVLTAAHCIKSKEEVAGIIIKFGRVNFTFSAEPFEQVRTFDRLVVHPFYGENSAFDYDYALIKLHSPVRFSPYVRRICLPDDFPESVCKNKWVAGLRTMDGCTHGLAIGWNLTLGNDSLVDMTTTLRKKAVDLSTDQKCIQGGLAAQMSDAQFCAGTNLQGNQTCQGDSGGPFVCEHHHANYIAGVVSYSGVGCNLERSVTLYSRVCQVIPWIRRTISSCPKPLDMSYGGFIEIGNSTIGSKRFIRCYLGYEVHGPSFIECRSDGTWSIGGVCRVQPLDDEAQIKLDEQLFWATAWNNTSDALALITLGAKNSKSQTHFPYTALHRAALNGNLEIVQQLLEIQGTDVDVSTDFKTTPLMLAAYYGRIDTVKLLIANGAKINARNNANWTAMKSAVTEVSLGHLYRTYLGNHAEVADYLTKHGGIE